MASIGINIWVWTAPINNTSLKLLNKVADMGFDTVELPLETLETEVEHKPAPADGGDQLGQPVPIHAPLAKGPGGDNDVRSTGLQPARGVVEIHAAAEVQTTGIRRQCRPRRRVIARAELNDMAAFQAVAPVEFGEPRGGFFGDKIRAQTRAAFTERAADDLLHLAFMQINAGTKHRRQAT